MLLSHVTPARNLASIQAHGLLCSKSRGKIKAVWLGTHAALPWSLGHVGLLRGHRLDKLRIVTVSVPRGWLTRRRRGIWTCERDIPASRIVFVSYVEVYCEQAS